MRKGKTKLRLKGKNWRHQALEEAGEERSKERERADLDDQ